MNLLVCLGQGLGNMVQTTPCIRALHSLGHTVDLYLDGTWDTAHELFDGWAVVRAVYRKDAPPDCAAYDEILRTIWGRWPEPIKASPSDYVLSEADASWTVNEALTNLVLAERMGYRGPCPWAHVQYDERIRLADIVIAPGFYRSEHWRRRAYPHWPGVIERLKAHGMKYVVLGHRTDREPWWDDAACAPEVSLREAAGILAGARVVLGVDNGLCHMAAGVGTPVVVVFGSTPPLKSKPWGPRVRVVSRNLDCQPCSPPDRRGLWEACTAWRCMTDLHPDTVFGALRRMCKEIDRDE